MTRLQTRARPDFRLRRRTFSPHPLFLHVCSASGSTGAAGCACRGETASRSHTGAAPGILQGYRATETQRCDAPARRVCASARSDGRCRRTPAVGGGATRCMRTSSRARRRAALGWSRGHGEGRELPDGSGCTTAPPPSPPPAVARSLSEPGEAGRRQSASSELSERAGVAMPKQRHEVRGTHRGSRGCGCRLEQRRRLLLRVLPRFAAREGHERPKVVAAHLRDRRTESGAMTRGGFQHPAVWRQARGMIGRRPATRLAAPPLLAPVVEDRRALVVSAATLPDKGGREAARDVSSGEQSSCTEGQRRRDGRQGDHWHSAGHSPRDCRPRCTLRHSRSSGTSVSLLACPLRPQREQLPARRMRAVRSGSTLYSQPPCPRGLRS